MLNKYSQKFVRRSSSFNLPVINKKNLTNTAKINTCQIQQITKTLKFVPANNSSHKVCWITSEILRHDEVINKSAMSMKGFRVFFGQKN